MSDRTDHTPGEPRASDSRPELGVLTSVRAFAALEVVLLHTLFELGGTWALALPAPLRRILTEGQVAVSFFFVLSGFILTYTYWDPPGDLRGSPRHFWRARFARIYPLYLLAFIMDAPRGLVSFSTASPAALGAWMRIAISAFAYLTLTQSWHPRVTNSWNTPGWSLSAEAFFYALFPRLVAATKAHSRRRLLLVAVVAWSVPLIVYAAVAGFGGAFLHRADVQTFWRSFPLLRVPEFVLGVGAGALYVSGELAARRRGLRRLAFFALAGIVILLAAPLPLPKELVENTLEAPLFAIVIAALASGALPVPRWLTSAPLLLLGRASYAVYIVHQPFKSLFLWSAARLGVPSLAPSPVLLGCYLVSLQLLCVALLISVEDPLRRLLNQRRADARSASSTTASPSSSKSSGVVSGTRNRTTLP